MKKSNLFFVGAFMLCSQLLNAQDIFKQHGFTKEPLTLSNGNYNEFFNNDEVVQIGTVLLNTKTMNIVAFVKEELDTAYNAELSSRWLSVDPLARKYPQLSPYVYVANNPIRNIDPDGRKIVDANGNIIYTQKGGWAKNAAPDAMRIGNGMMATRTNTENWNRMVNSSTNIQLEVSQATVVNGSTYTLGQMIPGKVSVDSKGKVQLLDAKIVVYEGTINKFMEKSKNSKNDKAVSYQMNTTNNDERVAAVAAHESIHTTQENVQQNYENTVNGATNDLEKKPVEMEMKVLDETGAQNIKPMVPIIPEKVEIK